MIFRTRLFWFTVAAALFVAACGSAPKRNERPVQKVVDDLKREVSLPMPVARVVSLAPSATEMVYAVGAGDRLVGDTTYCNYPEQAKYVEKVGDTVNPNLERIIALKPDVVLVSTASQLEGFTRTLGDNGIAVYVTDPSDIVGILRDMEQLGAIFGTEEAAAISVKNLKDRLFRVRKMTLEHTKTRVFVQISKEPLFTIGRTSFLTSVLPYANAESVTEDVDTAYPKISKEAAATLDPDAIILSDSDDNTEPNEAFKNSAAVKNGRVYKIDADILARPGPRVAEALEEIARRLYGINL
ncbi:MAG: cobalamin-binding protein [Chloracidobacterium sp.]|nr:cobalamin-binding protein [Chloracidobacterium sp.]MCC6825660.1 cobalamin-binding protein [Acidobacteriota bacterium]